MPLGPSTVSLHRGRQGREEQFVPDLLGQAERFAPITPTFRPKPQTMTVAPTTVISGPGKQCQRDCTAKRKATTAQASSVVAGWMLVTCLANETTSGRKLRPETGTPVTRSS